MLGYFATSLHLHCKCIYHWDPVANASVSGIRLQIVNNQKETIVESKLKLYLQSKIRLQIVYDRSLRQQPLLLL